MDYLSACFGLLHRPMCAQKIEANQLRMQSLFCVEICSVLSGNPWKCLEQNKSFWLIDSIRVGMQTNQPKKRCAPNAVAHENIIFTCFLKFVFCCYFCAKVNFMQPWQKSCVFYTFSCSCSIWNRRQVCKWKTPTENELNESFHIFAILCLPFSFPRNASLRTASVIVFMGASFCLKKQRAKKMRFCLFSFPRRRYN